MKDYFSHDYNARNDKKLAKLFMKYGLEGIGAYWCLVEMLYEEGGYLLLNEYECITFELRTSNELINYLIRESELFKNDGNKFWSDSAIDRLKQRADKSQKARESIEKRWKKMDDTNVLRTNKKRNTIKVKESKVNKSKVNINPDSFLLIEFSKSFFEEKYLNGKTPQIFNSLLKEYSIEKIIEAIQKAKSDNFWNDKFLSPRKLNSTNKEGVKYIDVFLNIKCTKKEEIKKQFDPKTIGQHPLTQEELDYMQNDPDRLKIQ
jgi:hypothetical protein